VTDAVNLDPLSQRYQLSTIVYADAGPGYDDPAEDYHEASKLSPLQTARAPGAGVLAASHDLQRLTRNAVKRHEHCRAHPLPEPEPLAGTLGEAIASRRSARAFGLEPLRLSALATLLDAAYGVVETENGPRRTSPSGGALYPLELYALTSDVEGLAPGLYHYDPLRHSLEELWLGPPTALGEALVYPEQAAAPLLVVVTAMFWRSRFKYSLRGYRFSLLEAGHLMQSLLLACAALGLAGLPIGGFYDRRLERLLSIDGVNEAVLYCAAVGNCRRPLERS
jgi:SagB-type dehydrogenase family enzyme